MHSVDFTQIGAKLVALGCFSSTSCGGGRHICADAGPSPAGVVAFGLQVWALGQMLAWRTRGRRLYLFQAAGMPRGRKRYMSLGWVLLGLVGWAFGLVVVLALFRMAGDQDRAARHEQKRLDPYSDVTITRAGDA